MTRRAQIRQIRKNRVLRRLPIGHPLNRYKDKEQVDEFWVPTCGGVVRRCIQRGGHGFSVRSDLEHTGPPPKKVQMPDVLFSADGPELLETMRVPVLEGEQRAVGPPDVRLLVSAGQCLPDIAGRRRYGHRISN